ncbi:hypothetical protein F2Q70_00014763 [Brassica cretica]|uniref:Uncharacterized protein n=1 Tax=Brassica cretica TaxID=69181 RepID=A0A8S9I165_BRACR|nr:hypothetical protein F2Q70_00014763 [Brassica cretica]KAF2600006.1 hypothetical protein F2Q68_00007857 [Brassica cretica]
MDMLFSEFGTFGDGLETRMMILVHKTSYQLSQQPNAAAKTSRWRNSLLPARYLEDAAAKRQETCRWSVQRPSTAAN